MEADPDTKADVDLMILDYLVSIAIDRTLCAVDKPSREITEEVDWLVDTVRGEPPRQLLPACAQRPDKRLAFQSTVAPAPLENPLPQDLDIKVRVLRVADKLRKYTPVLANLSSEKSSRLSSIALEFMDLCSTARSKISESRWFDTGARFLVQATLEEHREGNAPSEMLHTLSAWTPRDPAWNSKWATIRQKYASELPDPGEMSAAHDSLRRKFPFSDLEVSVLTFLFDLMTTLDPPLLIQLERGQVGQLSCIETQHLKERIGIR